MVSSLANNLCLSHQFNSLQKEIEERCSDIEALKLEQQKLQGIIKALEKDIQGLKREIQERDETIQDKVSPLEVWSVPLHLECDISPFPAGFQCPYF